MSAQPQRRHSLTNLGGAVQTVGSPLEARDLAYALDVAAATDAEDDSSRRHVHGFHSYPARMHPDTACRLIQRFTLLGWRLLDPFCGSGTVLVEAKLHGRVPWGTDLNPLAVRLTRAKLHLRRPAEMEQVRRYAAQCSEFADSRRLRRAGASRRYSDEDCRLFEPHVLLELDSLRTKLEELPENDPVRIDLSLVLSAMLVKFSRKLADTAGRLEQRRTAPGCVSRFFVQKTADFLQRVGEFQDLCPAESVCSYVAVDDATGLRALPELPVDAIVTSPPYAGTYDYFTHHELRLRWLGLEVAAFRRKELGSRAKYRRLPPIDAHRAWAEELKRFLTAANHVLRVGGPLLIVIADSAVGGQALRADDLLGELAQPCGFRLIARASQPRRHFHGPTEAVFRRRPRREHVVLLEKLSPGIKRHTPSLGKANRIRSSE